MPTLKYKFKNKTY